MAWLNRNQSDTSRLRKQSMRAAYQTTFATSAQLSFIGRRNENQDTILQSMTLDGTLLCIVADGLGRAGQQISNFAAHSLSTMISAQPNRDLRQLMPWAVDQIHRRISHWASQQGANAGGSTLDALAITPGRVVLAHVGDSRTYLIRQQRAYLLTRDHTVAGMLAAQPGAGIAHSNQLLRFLGSGEAQAADYTDLSTQPGDVLIICSDGLWGMLIEADLISHSYRNYPIQIVEELARLAVVRGSTDNISLIVVQMR